jgi:sugar lactone lactonase YvrE
MKTIRPIPTSIALAICWAASSFAQDFVSNEFADVVIGKPTFTVSTPITATASTTGLTSDAVVDPTTGELFVVDTGNNRVLRFSSAVAATIGASAQAVFGQPDLTTGTANTGGLSATSLNGPTGIYIDASGALWVADTGNNRVLRFDAATAVSVTGATTTADQVIGQANFTTATSGTTLTTLNGPHAVSVDASGNLWVADSLNNRVLRFDSVTSLGNGATATRVLGQANGTTATAASTQAGMSNPSALAVDASGNLWIADTGNNRVLRFASAASISTDGANATAVLGQINFTASAAATTQAGLSGPRGVAVNSAGRLWVSDTGNNRVLWYDNASALANGSVANGVLGHANFSTSASGLSSQQFNTPLGVSQDTAGHLWVADSGNARVLRFSAEQVPPPSLIPPVITLTGHPRIIFPAASQQIRGRASDSDGTVVAVEGSLNGGPFTLAKGTTSWRFHAHKLRKGVNTIRLVAIDDDGLQSNTLIVKIIRRTPNFDH